MCVNMRLRTCRLPDLSPIQSGRVKRDSHRLLKKRFRRKVIPQRLETAVDGAAVTARVEVALPTIGANQSFSAAG